MDRMSILSRLPETAEEGIVISGAIFAKYFRAGGYTGDTESADKVRQWMEELDLDLPMTRSWWHRFTTDSGSSSSWIQGTTTENYGLVTIPSRTSGAVRVFICRATQDPDSGWYRWKDEAGDWANALCIGHCDTMDEAESLVWGENSYASCQRSIEFIEQSSAERADKARLLTKQLDDALDF